MATGHDLILSAVRERLAPHLGASTHVLVGLSGGLDSVVLLHVLAQLRNEFGFGLSAIHVHHGLSPNADAWATFCQQLCFRLDIPCSVTRLSLPDPTGKGVEQTAREARYHAFAAASGDILCLAHHQNDRAETFLLNLFRGAGVTGLAGVPDRRSMGQKYLLRPLIDLPRASILAWAVDHQLRWIEDESNHNLAYRRNFVRHRILPAITEAFPGAVRVLARTSAHMAEQAMLLDRLAEIDAQPCRDSAGLLSVARLQKLSEPVARNVIRRALQQAGIQIPAARRLEAFAAQLMGASGDSEAFVRMGSVGIHLWRDQLWLDTGMDQPCPAAYRLCCGSTAWPDGVLMVVNVPPEAEEISVAPLGHGQRFQPVGRCHDRVSELLRAQGVPPWARPRMPGLWRGNTLCWAAGLGWAEGTQASALYSLGEIIWQPDDPVRL